MKKTTRKLTHEEKVQKCEDFLKNFEDYEQSHVDLGSAYEQYGRRKYLMRLQQLANYEIKTFQILLEDLESFFRKEEESQLLEGFVSNTQRYAQIFDDLVLKNIPKRNVSLSAEEEIRNKFENVLREQRRDNLSGDGYMAENQNVPKNMNKDFNVVIIRGMSSLKKIQAIHDFRSDRIGGLVTCKAIVIRTTEIKPQLLVATYACDVCGCENYFQVKNQHFNPMTKCQSKKCIENKINGKLTFLAGHSKFYPYQELKIQQTPDQLKDGKIPQTFTVYTRGNLVKQASPGDIIVIQGVLMIHRRPGFKNQHDLAFDTHLEAYKITRQKKKYIEMNVTEAQRGKIDSVRSNIAEDDLFDKLAKSIAPEIYGMQDVKKALLLLMAGGITKQTHDNMKIRGEINIALIGDPGIAKSQLLKHISSLAPRGIYTTGKGSSGVGLTAAIVKDPFTKELALEAGALVLADMGVCCIDEFDKMDEYDRTAIHEVMEQQTISIAKAGITTTLNARTSILAAANPIMGRYDRKLTPHKNINLPAALLSRFDLIFILLDTAEAGKDLELAKHIGMVHQLQRSPIENQIFDPSFLRAYIALSKTYMPTINEELHHEIIGRYIKKRQEQMDSSKEGENYTTMRSLLALIRLCQARARLRFSNEVSNSDINDCLQIIEESQKNVIGVKASRRGDNGDNLSAVFQIIKDLCIYSPHKSVELSILQKRVLARGHTEQVLEIALNHYEKLDVLMFDGERVTLVE